MKNAHAVGTRPIESSTSGAEVATSVELGDRGSRIISQSNNSLTSKTGVYTTTQVIDNGEAESQEDFTLEATQSTAIDAAAMKRMGKDQQLIRNFRTISVIAFTSIASASWEIGLFVLTPALVDGGVSGMCWSIVWSAVGWIPIYLSIAEMSSMAPIAGSQYHWVSGKIRRVLQMPDCRLIAGQNSPLRNISVL